MTFTGYNTKKDIPEILNLTEDELAVKEQLKKDIIYTQIISDLSGDVFNEWIEELLKYQDRPPGYQFTKKYHAEKALEFKQKNKLENKITEEECSKSKVKEEKVTEEKVTKEKVAEEKTPDNLNATS